ncbi:hypothetical protein LCGC14_2431010, partial [marine sediment metagenome]
SDSKQIWAGATATEIVVGADFSALELVVSVLDAAPAIDVRAIPVLGSQSAVVVVGGATYSDGDEVLVVGGIFTRAAKYKVLETAGVVDTVELVDPGEYTVMPSSPAATTKVAGGGDDNLTLTLTNGADAYANLMGKVVSLLNATAINDAEVDMSAAGLLLTIASIADGIGDKQLVVEMQLNGIAIPSLIGALTDEGVAGAVLTAAIPASPVAPRIAATLSA